MFYFCIVLCFIMKLIGILLFFVVVSGFLYFLLFRVLSFYIEIIIFCVRDVLGICGVWNKDEFGSILVFNCCVWW